LRPTALPSASPISIITLRFASLAAFVRSWLGWIKREPLKLFRRLGMVDL
jgi:hypothetical protein